MSRDLHGIIQNYIQGTLDSMLKCAEDECPQLLASDKVSDDIRRACREKIVLPLDFVETCVMDQAGTDIINRVK